MLLSLNFTNLSKEGFAAFILAILFTVLSVAGVIFFARHTKLNKIALVVINLVLPFLAVLCWVYLLLDVLAAYKPLINLAIAAGAAVAYVVIALIIAFLVGKMIENKKNNMVEKVVEEEPRVVAAPLLIETTVKKAEPIVDEDDDEEEEVVEPVKAEEPVLFETIEDEEEEETEEGVVFSNEPRRTFDEQLEELKYDIRSAYEEILAYAQAQEGTKTKKAKYQVTVSVGRMKLVLFKFIRGTLVSSFMAGSSELKNYSAAEKAVKIKEKPVLVEVGNGDSVEVAKNMVDIVYKNITDAKEELKEAKKAERKAKKAAEKLANEGEQPAEPKRRGRKKKSEQPNTDEDEDE